MRVIEHLLIRLWRQRVIKVVMIGAVGIIVQTIIFEIFGIWLMLVRPSTAVLIGAEFGIVTNFLLNNFYAFNDSAHAPFLVRFARFHIMVMGSLFLQWLFVFIAESATSNVWVLHAAYGAGILLGFVANYTGYRLWVWRNPVSPEG